jgi:phage gpG-like protein
MKRGTLEIRVDIDIQRAMRRLAMIDVRAKNLTPVFLYAQQRLRLANAENFAVGGLPAADGPWKPRKDGNSYAHPLMIRSGKLMNSLTSLFGPPNLITPTKAVFGTNVEYAKFHQYGTTKMPARKVVFEPRGFGRDLAQRTANYIANGTI